MIDFILYLSLRIFTYPIRWLPQRVIRFNGAILGWICFYCIPKLRKRATSNIALATDLGVPFGDIPRIARKSLENLAITCLEFIKFSYIKDLDRYIDLQDESGIFQKEEKRGGVFACPHLANWELFFLQGSRLFPLVGIARPLKNLYLNAFVKKTRERFGGQLFPPKNGVKECLRALNQKKIVGLIVDQATPRQGLKTKFFGRKAYATTIAALLAYKTKTPIIPATLSRGERKYQMHFHPPLYPKTDRPIEEEVERLVLETFRIFEKSIQNKPEEWLWIHNRYKQDPRGFVKISYRHDSILAILPEEEKSFKKAIEAIQTLPSFYPESFITVLIPKKYQDTLFLADVEIILYDTAADVLLSDYRFKLVFNFTSNSRISKHYKRLSAFHVINAKDSENMKKVLSYA
jgi:KDO2-lipid IV(A) lauroyltransferase